MLPSSSPGCKTSPHLTSPHRTSPHLTTPHLTSPHLISSHPHPHPLTLTLTLTPAGMDCHSSLRLHGRPSRIHLRGLRDQHHRAQDGRAEPPSHGRGGLADRSPVRGGTRRDRHVRGPLQGGRDRPGPLPGLQHLRRREVRGRHRAPGRGGSLPGRDNGGVGQGERGLRSSPGQDRGQPQSAPCVPERSHGGGRGLLR